MSKKTFLLFFTLLFLTVALSACSFPWDKEKTSVAEISPEATEAATTTASVTAEATGKLKKFNNYDELAIFLAAYNNPASAAAKVSAKLLESTASAAGVVNSSAVKPNNSFDYSIIDNQAAGVDQADIIKTDGRYIYALVKNDLSIIDANAAASAEVLSKITFKSRPSGIFISGNYLAVFGEDTNIASQSIYDSFRRRNTYTFLKVFDVSNPASPKQTRDLDFEGYYRDARLVGDYVYFVTDTYSNYIAGEPLLPRVIESGQVLPERCSASGGKCFAPEVYYFDISYDSYSFVNLAAVNIKNNSEAVSGQAYLLGDGQEIYVSGSNVYITQTPYLNEAALERDAKKESIYPLLKAADQETIKEIEATPFFVLNAQEKKSKEAPYLDSYLNSLGAAEQTSLNTQIQAQLAQKIAAEAKNIDKTRIYKIGLGSGKMSYLAMGEVGGQIMNKFSINENGNYLRLATARSPYSPRLTSSATDSYSSIYILDANLSIVGKLENLATTEKIYAARFIGSRAYLVTLAAADPLFVINLNDPAKPAVLGAVTLPGLNNYLYPIDANGTKLLSLGREAKTAATGNTIAQGLKLSLFDFSDLAKPKELDSYFLGSGDSDSIALLDHKAFLYSGSQNLLVIPAALRDSNNALNFAGALAFTLKDNSLTLRGRVDHSAGGHYGTADYWDSYSYFDNTVKRSFYINEALFTFSNKFLKINNLKDAAVLKSLELTVGGDDYIVTPTPAATSTPAEAATPVDSVISPETLSPEVPALEIPAVEVPAMDTSTPAVVN
jgi:uncharacterized secreted protein with C-terminal beta-propeller domain